MNMKLTNYEKGEVVIVNVNGGLTLISPPSGLTCWMESASGT
jgi:hypothetical protein